MGRRVIASSSRGRLASMLVALALGAPPTIAAETADERPRIAATRATGPIRIDGALDEPEWRSAQAIRDFRLVFVREGEAPSESTDVRVVIDDARIVFGIRCENRGPGAVRASVAPRDQITEDDFIAVHLDTYRDFHRAYVFGVNPFGVQIDGILTGGDVDFDWDGVWDAEARRDGQGWSAEIAVPLRVLRFPSEGPGVWGLWVRRTITKNDEILSWPLWRQSVAGDIMLQAADLTGLEGLRGGGRVELQPYATSTQAAWRAYDSAEDALGGWVRDHDEQAGLDLEFAPTATLVLNGTLNPDYSQVEADALQFDVNQRYPLFFPEKRPFFLEGADYFASPLQLVYTRRVANPDYGLKATGTIGRVRLGGLVARDAGGGSLEGIGASLGEAAAARGTFEIGRAVLEIGDQSSVGALVAARQTDRPTLGFDDAVVSDRGGNLVVAGDWRFRLAKPLFFIGQVAGNRSHFERDSVPADTLGDARDVAYTAELNWKDGVRYLSLYHAYLGPDFRSETGFLSRIDVRKSVVYGTVIVRPENAWLRSWEPILDVNVWHDHQGQLERFYWSPMIDWVFQKQTHVHTMYEQVRERWRTRTYDQGRAILIVDNSLWRPLAVDFEATVGEAIFYAPTDAESFRGWSEVYECSATARPTSRLTSEIEVSRSRFSRRRGGEEVFDVWLVGANTTFQFTRRLYARVYPQFDSESEHVQADALLGYVVHPGTVVYLGVNHGLDRWAGHHRVTQRTVFLKASYAWVR